MIFSLLAICATAYCAYATNSDDFDNFADGKIELVDGRKFDRTKRWKERERELQLEEEQSRYEFLFHANVLKTSTFTWSNIFCVCKQNRKEARTAYRSRRQRTPSLVKIVLLGGDGTGKNHLVQTYCNGDEARSENGGFELSNKYLQLDDNTVNVQLVDTPSQERFRKIAYNHYK